MHVTISDSLFVEFLDRRLRPHSERLPSAQLTSATGQNLPYTLRGERPRPQSMQDFTGNWCWRRGSNSRPSVYKTAALRWRTPLPVPIRYSLGSNTKRLIRLHYRLMVLRLQKKPRINRGFQSFPHSPFPVGFWFVLRSYSHCGIPNVPR